ncbi:MAG: hypothetical protein U1F36_11135 [Planctomycetota bacterium]
MSDFLSDVAGTWRVGATVLLSRYKESTSRRHAAAFEPNALFVIADPESQKLELPFAQRGRGRDDLAYLQESSPAANVTRFVSNVLQAQIDNGREILISPWLVHGATPNTRSLHTTLSCARAAAASPLANDHQLWFGFQITHNVVSADKERNDFLNELVELPAKPIYLRIQIEPPDGPRQFADEAVIRGLREVVSALSDNGMPVVIAQAGLLGWLMLPFGAKSFGAGTRMSMQRTVAPSPGFARQPLNWFFVPQFLGCALAEEMPQIAAVSGYQPCTCPYCDGNLPDTGDDFDREAAGKHYLWWCARLANELIPVQPLTALRQRIGDSESFWNQVQRSSVVLDDRSHPLHLASWLAAVS